MVRHQEIKKMISQNLFKEALILINTVESSQNIDLEESIVYRFLKTQILVNCGKTEEGLVLADKALVMVRTQTPVNQLLLLNAIITKIEALRCAKQFVPTYSRGNLSQHLLLLEEGESLLESTSDLKSLERTERVAILFRNKGLIFRALGEYDRAINTLQKSKALYQILDKKGELIQVLLDLAEIFGLMTDCNRQLDILQECLNLNHTINDQEGFVETFLNFASVYLTLGDLETAFSYIQKTHELIEGIPSSRRIAHLYFNLGLFYYNAKDQTTGSFSSFQRSLSLMQELDDKDGIQLCSHLLGDLHQYVKGDFNEALEYYENSEAIYQENGTILVHCWNLLDMGNLYHLKGDLDAALLNFEKALPLLEDIKNDFYFCQTFLHIGRVYRSKGDNSTALGYYKQCLKELDERRVYLRQETEGLAFYESIAVMLDSNDIKEAKKYFERFTQFYLANSQRKQFLKQWYNLAEALILKNSVRIKDKARAQQLFQEIIDDPNVQFKLLNYLADSKRTAVLNLCELLLFELKSSSDEITEKNEIFQEVKQILSNLALLAQEQHSFPLLVDVIILQAKLALIEGFPTKSMQFLSQAKITAEEKNLQLLFRRVVNEEAILKTQLSIWQRLIEENAPLQERLAQAQVEEYLLKAKKIVNLSPQSPS